MARIHTHYDNLKVARNAPPEVIRAAYKTLSQKYHPDRNPNSPDAIRIIQIINSAYEVLSDPVKRQEHDHWIAKSESSTPGTTSPTNTGFSSATVHSDVPRKTRRRTFFGIGRHRSHRKPLFATAKVVHKAIQSARRILDQFSRYFVRKV